MTMRLECLFTIIDSTSPVRCTTTAIHFNSIDFTIHNVYLMNKIILHHLKKRAKYFIHKMGTVEWNAIYSRNKVKCE